MHRIVQKLGILLSLSLVTGLIIVIIISKATDFITEIVFGKIYKTHTHPQGLDPRSDLAQLLVGAEPAVFSRAYGQLKMLNGKYMDQNNNFIVLNKSKYGIIIVHGVPCVPADYFDIAHTAALNLDCDVYVPLLAYHGRPIQELTNVNLEILKNQLIQDIKYVLDHGYEKVLCIGHSFGAALLADLSLNDAFKADRDRVKLILYAPSIYIHLNKFKKCILYCFAAIKKYLNLPIEFRYSSNQWVKMRFFQFFTRSIVLAVYNLAESLNNQILVKQKQFHNSIGVISIVDDEAVRFENLHKLFKVTPSVKLRILNNGGHAVHASDDPEARKAFFNAIEDLALELIAQDPA